MSLNDLAPRSMVRIFMLTSVFVLVLAGVFSFTRAGAPQRAYAATSSNLNYQARLLSSSGNLVPDGYYNLEFKLYSAATGGSALWTERHHDTNGTTPGGDNRVRVVNGYLSVNLGSVTAFPALNWDQDMWLTMNVGGATQTATPVFDGEMSPRIKLTAVPYAFQAQRAEQLTKSIGSYLGTLQFPGSLAGNTTYNLTDPGVAFPSVDICLSSGNCAGSGGGLVGSGTAGRLGVFGSSNSLGNSYFLQGPNSVTIDPDKSLVVDTDTFVVDAANNRVGIGTATPAYKLDVVSSDPISARFSGRIIAANAVNNNEVVTLEQLNSAIGGSGSILQGGNSFGAPMVIGTNDLQGLTVRTNGAARLSIDNAGAATFHASLTVASTVYAGGAGVSLTGTDGGILKGYTTSGTVNQNDVVVMVNDGGVKAATSTTPRDARVLGVYRGASGSASGSVAIAAHSPVNATSGAVAIGDQLVVSNEAGRVMVDNNATTGILGYASTAKAAGSPGLVGVRIQIENGQYSPTFTGTVTASGSGTGLSVTNNATVGGNLSAADINATSGSIRTGGTERISNSGNLNNIGSINATGTLTFGGDTTLRRSAANMLATDDSFSLLGTGSNLTVQGTGTSVFEGHLTVNGNLTVKDFGRVLANSMTNTYYSSIPNALAQSPMGRSWHDLFAFNRANGTPSFEQSADGTAWTAGTLNSQVFAQTEDVPVSILNGTTSTAARYTWNSGNLAWSSQSMAWLVLKVPYTGATAANKTILVETSLDGVAWTARANVSGVVNQQQTIYMPVTGWGDHTRLRITVTSTNGQPVSLSGIQMLSDRVGSQGLGREYEFPYAWDTNMNLRTLGTGGASGVLRVGGNTINADGGMYFGTDTNLYRAGNNLLRTDDSFSVAGSLLSAVQLSVTNQILSSRAADTGSAYQSNVMGDTVARFVAQAGGRLQWGTGTSAPDTSLYRNGVNLLETGGSFNTVGALTQGGVQVCLISGNCAGTGGNGDILQGGNTFGVPMVIGTNNGQTLNFETNNSIVATFNTAGQLQLAADGVNGGLVFSGDAGANLYRGGAGLLVSSGSIMANSLRVVDSGSFDARNSDNAGRAKFISGVTGDPNSLGRFYISAGGNHYWGDGTAAPDTNLYRDGVGVLGTGSSLNMAGVLTFTGIGIKTITTTSNQTLRLDPHGTGRVELQGSTTYVDALGDIYQNGNKVCDTSGNCAGSGAGDILQGGNTFGTAMTIGTNDNNALNFKTNNNVVASLTTGGQLQISTTGVGGGLLLGGDANLYRSAANLLQTDGSLNIGGSLQTGGVQRITNNGILQNINQAILRSASGQSEDIIFARDFDADNTLRYTTNGNLNVRSSVSGNRVVLSTSYSSASYNTFEVTAGGKLSFGSGVGGSTDTNLYRFDVNSLRTDGALDVVGALTQNGSNVCTVAGNCAGLGGNGDILQGGNTFGTAMTIGTNDNNALNFETNGSTVATLTPAGMLQLATNGAAGGLQIGDDAYLYRSASGTLRTDGGLIVSGQLTAGGLLNSTGAIIAQRTNATDRALDVKLISDAGPRLRVTANGSIAFGDGLGTLDTNLYRNAADILKTDDAFDASSYLANGVNGISTTCSGGQILQNQVVSGGIVTGGTCTSAGASLSLQNAYGGGNTVTTTDARNISFTLADTVTDSNFLVNIASGSTGRFAVRNDASDIMSINSSGRLLLSAQGSGGGLLIGGDASLFRSGASTLSTSGAFVAYNGDANQIALGRTASAVAGAGITFGSAQDTNLYRDSANLLKTDDSFTVGANLQTNGNFSQTGSGTFSTGTGLVSLNGNTNISGTLTVSGHTTLSARTLQVSNTFPMYTWQLNNSMSDVDWKKIADVALPIGTYQGASFRVNITDANCNHGCSADVIPMEFYVSALRSGGTVDVPDTGYVSGPVADYVRLVKTATGVYELQVRAPVTHKTLIVNAQVLSKAAATITYVDNPVNGSTVGDIYMPSLTGYTQRFASVAVGGNLQVGGLTVITPSRALQNVTASTDILNAGTLGITRGGTGVNATPANGRLLIGNGTGYTLANLTPGNGISITNGAGSISIAVNTGSLTGDFVSLQGATPGTAQTGNINVSGTIIGSSFSGSGAGLTNLNASAVASGTLGDGYLSGNVALLNRNSQVFTGNDQIFRNSTNSANAFRIQNSSSETLFNADTVNQRVNIGSATSSARLTVSGSFSNASTWAARTPPAVNPWKAIAYGNGQFVAVSSSGVMTSPDGINWTSRTGILNSWNSVTYGNGQFVAVSSTGPSYVMTSPDGINWTSRTASEASYWNSVTYGNGQFVAVAFGGTNRVMTSPDGINWTSRTASEVNYWYSVTYGNGLFVAVAGNGSIGTNRVMTSPDGITWTARTVSISNWKSVTYGNGLFVAVSQSETERIMTSPDGINWTNRTPPAVNSWQSVVYGNGLYVAASYDGGANQIMTSPDGITWTAQASVAGYWQSITYGNGLFVAVGDFGSSRIMTSSGGYQKAMTINGDVDINGTIRQNGYEVCTTAGNCKSGSSVMGDILQNGNSFGQAVVLGTNDNFGLQFETNGTTRLTINNVGNATFTGTITTTGVSIGGGVNLITTNGSNQLRYTGTSRNTKKLILTPEYAGAVLDGTGLGMMTAGYDATRRENYYKWQDANNGSPQTYKIVLTVPVPSDWDAWAASNALSVNVKNSTYGSTDVSVIGTTGVADVSGASGGIGTAWQTINASLTNARYNADGTMTITLSMGSNLGDSALVGNITLTYFSKF